MNPPPDRADGRPSRRIERIRAALPVGREDGRPAALVEVIGLLLGLLLFTRLQATVGKDVAAATANAMTLQAVERALHINIERPANHWLTGHPVLIHLAVYGYRLYYAVIVGVLWWVFVRHAEVYVKVRRTLVAMAVLVLPIYWALPMSPPRFAQPGVVDIVAAHDILAGPAARGGTGPGHYTAMPSLHVGWSTWCAYAVWTALRGSHPRLALLSWVFPLLMAADVLATGNHYVLDLAGSAVLFVVSLAAASGWGHLARRWRRTGSRRSGAEVPA